MIDLRDPEVVKSEDSWGSASLITEVIEMRESSVFWNAFEWLNEISWRNEEDCSRDSRARSSLIFLSVLLNASNRGAED